VHSSGASKPRRTRKKAKQAIIRTGTGQKKFRIGNNLSCLAFSMIGAKGYAFIFARNEDERQGFARTRSREHSNHKSENDQRARRPVTMRSCRRVILLEAVRSQRPGITA
jgi:hypothetical protein